MFSLAETKLLTVNIRVLKVSISKTNTKLLAPICYNNTKWKKKKKINKMKKVINNIQAFILKPDFNLNYNQYFVI